MENVNIIAQVSLFPKSKMPLGLILTKPQVSLCYKTEEARMHDQSID